MERLVRQILRIRLNLKLTRVIENLINWVKSFKPYFNTFLINY